MRVKSAPIGAGTNEPLNVKSRRLSKTTGPPIDAILPLSAESRLRNDAVENGERDRPGRSARRLAEQMV